MNFKTCPMLYDIRNVGYEYMAALHCLESKEIAKAICHFKAVINNYEYCDNEYLLAPDKEYTMIESGVETKYPSPAFMRQEAERQINKLINYTMLEFKGKIIAMLDKKEGIASRTGKKYVLQEFVVETLEQYPRRAQFTLFGEDKINQYDLACGDVVTIGFQVNATESKGKWYNSFHVVNIKKEKVHHTATAPAAEPKPVSVPNDTTVDDLPF